MNRCNIRARQLIESKAERKEVEKKKQCNGTKRSDEEENETIKIVHTVLGAF